MKLAVESSRALVSFTDDECQNIFVILGPTQIESTLSKSQFELEILKFEIKHKLTEMFNTPQVLCLSVPFDSEKYTQAQFVNTLQGVVYKNKLILNTSLCLVVVELDYSSFNQSKISELVHTDPKKIVSFTKTKERLVYLLSQNGNQQVHFFDDKKNSLKLFKNIETNISKVIGLLNSNDFLMLQTSTRSILSYNTQSESTRTVYRFSRLISDFFVYPCKKTIIINTYKKLIFTSLKGTYKADFAYKYKIKSIFFKSESESLGL